MLAIKPGVSVFGLKPEILVALDVVRGAFDELGIVDPETGAECVLTSGSEAVHSAAASRHYSGTALDFRTRHLRHDQAERLLRRVRALLSAEYRIKLAFRPPHLHVAFVGAPRVSP